MYIKTVVQAVPVLPQALGTDMQLNLYICSVSTTVLFVQVICYICSSMLSSIMLQILGDLFANHATHASTTVTSCKAYYRQRPSQTGHTRRNIGSSAWSTLCFSLSCLGLFLCISARFGNARLCLTTQTTE